MLVTLVEVVENRNHYSRQKAEAVTSKYTLREVTVNPNHVVCLREDMVMTKRLDEGRLPEDVDPRQRFTKVYLDRGQSGLDLTVVGNLRQTQEKLGLNSPAKEVLRG